MCICFFVFMKDINIRQLNPEDWEIYRDIRLLMADESPLAFDDKAEDLKKYDKDEWVTFLDGSKNSITLGMFLKNNLVGNAAILTGEIAKGVGPQHIVGVYISPKLRGGGYAELLFNEVDSEAKKLEYKYLTLNVKPKNIRAIKFYEKIGYKIQSLDKNQLSYKKAL